jgi:hypothetical protein
MQLAKRLATDLMFLAGLALAIFGVWVWSHPLGLIVGGIVLAALGFLFGYDPATLRRRP